MEKVVNRKLYEGMFLVDSAQAADWDGTKSVLEGVLKRADSEIVEMKKWDDRRLAYEINGKARGAYILCYFNADCDKIQEVEKAVQLSDQIMRVLILNAEQMTEEDMKRETPLVRAEREAAVEQEGIADGTAEEDESDEDDDFDTTEDDPDDNEAFEGRGVAPGTDAEEESDEASAETETGKPKLQDAQ